MEIFVAEALVALASARTAEGAHDEAERILGEAVAEAGRLGERLPWWEALSLRARILDRRGAADYATECRRGARDLVDEIASGVAEEPLRRRFLERVLSLVAAEPRA